MGVDEALMIIKNEMNRLLALVNRRWLYWKKVLREQKKVAIV
jgi:hypothetical protein